MKVFILLSALIGIVYAQECEPDQFLCEMSGVCIPETRACDRYADCVGGTDEIGCPEVPTTECSTHTCPNGRCISLRVLCDGQNDCTDWSDETEELCKCPDNEWRCPRLPGDKFLRKCIPEQFICDENGIWDCPDGADEVNCTMTVIA